MKKSNFAAFISFAAKDSYNTDISSFEEGIDIVASKFNGKRLAGSLDGENRNLDYGGFKSKKKAKKFIKKIFRCDYVKWRNNFKVVELSKTSYGK